MAGSRLRSLSGAVLGIGTAACVFVFLYYLYHYAFTGERSFESLTETGIYFGGPLLCAAVLVAGLRSRDSYRINLAVLLVSFGFAVYVGEIILAYTDLGLGNSSTTLWGSMVEDEAVKAEVLEMSSEAEVVFDTRSRLEVLMDYRRQETMAVPTVAAFGFVDEEPNGDFKSRLTLNGAEVIPLGGVANRTTVSCNEGGEYAIYESDERGFHNPKGLWLTGEMEVAVLGDSYAHGQCVHSDASVPALIRHRFPRTLGLGIPGQGPLVMLATLKEYLPASSPRAVLWFYYEENDRVDLMWEGRSPLLQKYLSDDEFNQGLIDLQPGIDAVLTEYIESELTQELESKSQRQATPPVSPAEDAASPLSDVLLMRNLRDRVSVLFRSTEEAEFGAEELSLFREILSEAEESVSAWGGSLYFVYLPARDRYANGQDFDRNRVLDTVRDLGLPIIDMHEVFRTEDPLRLFPFRRFGHYNEEGYRLVSEAVMQAISVD